MTGLKQSVLRILTFLESGVIHLEQICKKYKVNKFKDYCEITKPIWAKRELQKQPLNKKNQEKVFEAYQINNERDRDKIVAAVNSAIESGEGLLGKES